MPTEVALCSSDAVVSQLVSAITVARTYQATRAVLITTADRDHAYHCLVQAALKEGVPLFKFSPAGCDRYIPERHVWELAGTPSSEPAELIRAAMAIPGPALVVLEEILPALREQGGEPQARMALARALDHAHGGRALILLGANGSDTALPGMVSAQVARVSVPLPSREALHRLVREELARAASRRTDLRDLAQLRAWADTAAPELAGLTRAAARLTLREALSLELDGLPAVKGHLRVLRAALLSRELGMSLLDADSASMPVGVDSLQEFLEINRARIGVPGKQRCKGVLLFGPPGTGKTMLAQAMGRLLNLPVVDFRFGAVMNSLLGETEKLFDRCFQTIDALSPAIVFIDEMDKLFAAPGGESDGGTMQRCVGRMLTWLSETEAPVFIVGTGNNPTRMGEVGQTMTRSGRFDGAFFLDTPGLAARRTILAALLAPLVTADAIADLAQRLAVETERFSGADLKAVVERAHARAVYRGEALRLPLLVQEVGRLRARSHALYEEFMPLRRWAQLHCEHAGTVA